MSAGLRLRNLMNKGCVAMPGAFNGLVGRLVHEAGFDAAYISGAAISGSAGVPDIGMLTLNDFSAKIKEVSMASGLPILADADTGFGEGEIMVKTVWEYYQAGAAGLHIEDQVFPKRCGHLDGKSLVPKQDFAEKVKRAVNASKACSNGDFIICARTDARGVESFDSAVERATAYVDAGADMIFPEGLHTEAEFEKFAKEMSKLPRRPYLLANMTEFGKTPMIPMKRFAELGYDCVIYPVSTLRMSMKPVQEMLAVLKETGTLESQLDKMYSRKELYNSLGYTPGVEWTYPDRSVDRK
eukprot:GDKK01014912.1.p1 GENE.GDKK01014912.1~~GDKK01014912.1.p1  ORF type:complete len:307 (+),score=102.20 GDKK01014912.1:29-922(+)